MSVALLAPCARALAADGPVLVFAAASLKTALDAIADGWRRDTGIAVRCSYAASSALARQIERGAPADLFVSADEQWMDYLQERSLIRTSSRRDIVGNRPVLIARADDPVTLHLAIGADLAGALGTSRLALGEVLSVPAGRYARVALERLGLWPAVRSRLAMTENVRAALALVARGEARLGIVYASDARADPAVRVVDVFPPDSHAAIVYPAALLVASGRAGAARFLDHLGSGAARRVFESGGFTVPAR